MATEIVRQSLPHFTDASGAPLNGSIYIGQAGADPVSNPITVYWDAELSIPAAQPLAVVNGFFSRSGVKARVYAVGDYSLAARNSAGSEVFVSLSGNSMLRRVNTQTVTAYTLQMADAEGIVEMNNASANEVTIPPNSEVPFPIGTRIDIEQIGNGATTIVAGSGVTLAGNPVALGIEHGLTIYKAAENTWRVRGGTT